MGKRARPSRSTEKSLWKPGGCIFQSEPAPGATFTTSGEAGASITSLKRWRKPLCTVVPSSDGSPDIAERVLAKPLKAFRLPLRCRPRLLNVSQSRSTRRRWAFALYFTLEFRQHYPANHTLYLNGQVGRRGPPKKTACRGWIIWARSSRDRELSVRSGGAVARLPSSSNQCGRVVHQETRSCSERWP